MSKTLFDLEKELEHDLTETDIRKLTEKALIASQIHDTVAPMINNVVTSVANSTSYEDAYKLLIDKLREMHTIIVNTKILAEQELLKTTGKIEVQQEILKTITELADEIREKQNEERVSSIAEKIQSGSYDPDTPRKIGTRPEKIKNIREAKRTLFGEVNSNNNDD